MQRPHDESTIFFTKARSNPSLNFAGAKRPDIGLAAHVRGLLRAGSGANCKAMSVSTSKPLPARPYSLPNMLTYARIVAVPIVIACMYWQNILQGGLWLRWVALALF